MSAWDIFGRPIPLVVTQQGKQITLDWPKEVKEEGFVMTGHDSITRLTSDIAYDAAKGNK